MTISPRTLSPFLLAALGSVSACGWSNAHHGQELPPITKLSTKMDPAIVEIDSLGVRLETPTNLPESIEPDTMIRIRKDGRLLFEGPLEDLPQVALGNYVLDRR